jgi:hypothetical protein
MTAKLLLACCLLLSAAAQCPEPTSKLATSFECAFPFEPTVQAARTYLQKRDKNAQIDVENGRLTLKNRAETVVIWVEQKDTKVKLRVEVRPGGQMPLLGESTDAMRQLRLHLLRELH